MSLNVFAEDLRGLRAVIQQHSLLASLELFRGLNLTSLEATNSALLKEQALELRSFLLGLAIEAYQASQSEQISHEQIAELVQWCLFSGRFKDILDLQDHYPCQQIAVLSASLLAAYRLSDWPRVISIGKLLPVSEKTFLDLSLIVRALLELDQFSEAFDLLTSLTPQSAEEERRKELLVLLSRFRSGIATSNDARRFLDSIEVQDQAELSCFFRYLSMAASYVSPSVLRDRVYPLAHLSGRRLRGETIYAGPYGLLPSIKSVRDGQHQSIAFVYPFLSKNGLNHVDALSLAIKSVDPAITVTHVAFEADQDVVALDRDDIIICISQTVWELLDQLRQQSFDVLIDCIGIRSASWLLALSQRIASLQLLWSDAPVDYLPEHCPYDAQLADRWTTPSAQEAGALPWLTITGTRQLTRFNVDGSYANPSDHSVQRSNRSELLVLGAPDQMLPGAAVLVQRLLNETTAQRVVMTDRAFQHERFLKSWWQFWNPKSNHESTLGYHPLQTLDHQSGDQLIAIDLCIESPCEAVLACLERGIPVVHLSSACIGSKGTVSILASLGLESLTRENPEELIEVVKVLCDINEPAYREISGAILANLPKSLLCNYELFASDLLEGIRVARGLNSVLTS